MKTQVRFFDIQWDTDGAKIDALPKETTIDVVMDDNTDIALEGADMLSDKFGWCVSSFHFNILHNKDNQGGEKHHIKNRRPGMHLEGCTDAKPRLQLSYPEISTLLAASRHFQDLVEEQGEKTVSEMFSHFDDVPCLSVSEVDALAERLNCADLICEGARMPDNEQWSTVPPLGTWADDENPLYPMSDWRHEVANEDTRLGYLEWLEHKIECAADDARMGVSQAGGILCPANNKETDRVEWETEVVFQLEEKLDATTSDAQGIMEAHQFAVSQAWGRGLDAAVAADHIISSTATTFSSVFGDENFRCQCGNTSHHEGFHLGGVQAMTSAEFHAARLHLGLTQSELGNIMGMPQSAIARLESGARKPTRQQSAFMAVLLQRLF